MNGETHTVDAVKTEQPEVKTLEQQMAAMRETAELHELYKKHDKGVQLDENGDEIQNEATYIDYGTVLCHGCGMPVGGDSKHVHIDAQSMDTLLESPKKYDNVAAYIICMQDRLDHWKRRPTTRQHLGHLIVDEMLVRHKEYIDHPMVREQLLQLLDGVKHPTNDRAGAYEPDPPQLISRKGLLHDVVRYEEHLMGKITSDTLKRLMRIVNLKEDPSWETTRDDAATLYLACALKYKMPMDRKVLSVLMKRCKNLRMKQEVTAQTGKFRLSAVKGTYFNEALASYHYINKYKPELLQDPKWASKKLRFDKRENRLVVLRYFIDHGLGWDELAGQDDLKYAVTKYIPTKHASCVDEVAAWKLEQLRNDSDDYRYVFGNDADRRKRYTVDSEIHLVHLCTNIEMFYKHLLSDDVRNQTGDPVADILRLPCKEAE